MPLKVTVHVMNEEPFVAQMESMPDPSAAYITFTDPRTREGKPAPWQSKGATAFIYPWSRITFIEVMVSEDIGDIEKFFRENR